MISFSAKRLAVAAGLTISVALCSAPAPAQIIVSDPQSLGQLVQSYAQQGQQLIQLQNQLTAQLNMLKSLGSDITPNVGILINQTQSALANLQYTNQTGAALNTQINTAYSTNFATSTPDQITAQIEQQQAAQRQVTLQAMNVQNQVISNAPMLEAQVQAATSASNAAAGPTGAIQATNQLLAALSQQMADIQALLASMASVAYNQALLQQQTQSGAQSVVTSVPYSSLPADPGPLTY